MGPHTPPTADCHQRQQQAQGNGLHHLAFIIMIKESLNADQILQIIPDPKAKDLLRTEIEQLSQHNRSLVLHNNRIFVKLQFSKPQFNFTPPEEQVHLVIKLKKGFPLSAPRVYMRTSITNPTTNDTRDYLRDILGKEWNYSIRLQEIEAGAPRFLQKINDSKKSALAIQKMGYFHLGQYFSYKLLKQCKGVEMFLAFWEIDDSVVMDYITVSDCHITVLRPELQPTVEEGKLHVPQQDKIDALRLMSYADVQAVSEIRTSRAQNSQVEIILKTQRQKKMNTESFCARLHYRVVKLKELLKKLLKVIPKFQTVDINYETTRKDEFLDIQNSVHIAENNLKKYFNKENINLLNSYYQSAVEQLSGTGNPAYLVYLNKITQLSLREDVKLVISTDK